jgi:DMSO/TMAO reductase YedYZ molybdopterin-dependent catalytic subunit
VTPRATDWGLAALVALGFVTGVWTLFAGTPASAWVFAVHGAGGFALAAFLCLKLPRVWARLRDPERRGASALAAVTLVALTLLSGWVWAGGGNLRAGGYNLLNWHFALGTVLALAVAAHMLVRAKPLRRADLAPGRRQLLAAGGVAAGAYGLWLLQRPASTLVGLRGARRRFTGSYERASFEGNAFPTTSWVADDPREIDPAEWRLRVEGRVGRELELPLRALDGRDRVTATLDCTGGFHSRQHWRGTSLARVIERAGPDAGASHVRVISKTGYRWSFSLEDARRLLLATRVGGEPISHGHGAPLRLVAPGRRGFEWVKWVERLELHDGPDPGALPSTVWSSFTAEGRGDA